MKLIYVHHAERNINENVSKQEQDITENGIKEASLLAEQISKLNIKCIYTSPYLRCVHTSKILNKHLNVSIYEDERLNEWNGKEEFKQFQERNMQCINEIVNKYNDTQDIVICVTSGVNLSAFVCYFANIKADNNNPKVQAINCSPVLFSTDDSCL